METTNYIPYKLLLKGYTNLNWIEKLQWNYFELLHRAEKRISYYKHQVQALFKKDN